MLEKEGGEAGCVALAPDLPKHVVRARVFCGGRRLLAPADVFGTCLFTFGYLSWSAALRSRVRATRPRRAEGEEGLLTPPLVLFARFKESPESACVLRVRVFASAARGKPLRSWDRTHPRDAFSGVPGDRPYVSSSSLTVLYLCVRCTLADRTLVLSGKVSLSSLIESENSKRWITRLVCR